MRNNPNKDQRQVRYENLFEILESIFCENAPPFIGGVHFLIIHK